MTESVSVLFVCLGNICRSPTAEGVFRQVVEQAGLADRIRIDSCGTGHWHVGKTPDARAQQAASQRGVDISQLRARQFQESDLVDFDRVLVMDKQNLSDTLRVWERVGGAKPELFLSYGRSGHDEVPDPYYGGDQGFEVVLDLINEASEGLLAKLRESLR
ncbi:low molecular weight protein-tyrosine-phosphatase [Marinobacter sp. CHS3-4]|uniref:low molecular weight protein-tyrosine-phosphatase n=1 Tax=Marinobacter sp. CHS3-4 TaxID=3045174 RepID=UPI0024B5368B|nr:low molecular weight protein-tyrosine-phosphatase [Marinobacter sp. CHS3-4]MDI9245670.1 low molecular weight protein-tyrosine-phosphatase [Marinobacter sp. CHS3-4]